MKKLLSVVICLALVFSFIPTGLTLAYDDGAQSYADAADLITALGLLPDSFNFNSKISREKFVIFLIKAMGLDGSQSGQTIIFDDVAPGSESYAAISTAYDLGIINGSGTSFMPKASLSYNQAIKMVVAALGYGDLAEAKGGYPYGYVSVANTLNLESGIRMGGDDALTGSDAVMLMYNALNSSVMQIASIGSGMINYSDASGRTMLDVYHGIQRSEGQLKATSGNVMSGDYELDVNRVIIDGVTYKTDGKNYDDLVGYSVYMYYHKSDNKIVALQKNSALNNELVVNADCINGLENGYLLYESDNKEKKIFIDPMADISYNGRPAKSADKDLFDLSDGEIKFIDSDSDGNYEAIIISDFENYVVSAVDASEKIISDLYTPGKYLEIGDTDEIFVDDFGNTMYYEELKKYDVISVWQSTDGKNIKMKYSNKEIKGTLTEKGDSDGGFFVIDGEKIKISKGFKKIADDIKLGSKGIFALDASGKVAAFKQSDDVGKLAYLIQAGLMGSALEEAFMIRVMKPDGSIVILNCNVKKLLIDGRLVTASEAKAYFTKSQLIRYDVNSDGEVIMIDTISDGTGDNDTLSMVYSSYNTDYTTDSAKRLRYSKGAKLFSGRVAVEADTPIFNVPHPETVEDDKNYYITYPTIYGSADYASFEAYKANEEDGIYSDVLISYNLSGKGEAIATKTPVTVIDDITAIVDEDGNHTYKLSCYYNGANYREYLFEDEAMYKDFTDASGNAHTLAKGDIVRLNVNSNTGIIKRIDLVYARETDVLTNAAVIGTTEYFLSVRYVKGRVYEKDGNFITLTQLEDIPSDSELNFDQKEIHYLYSDKVLVYDSIGKKPELVAGSLNDVLDFKNFGENCSDVVIFSVDGGDTTIAVVYK